MANRLQTFIRCLHGPEAPYYFLCLCLHLTAVSVARHPVRAPVCRQVHAPECMVNIWPFSGTWLFLVVLAHCASPTACSEIMLYSSGYLQARDLARKLVATYKWVGQWEWEKGRGKSVTEGVMCKGVTGRGQSKERCWVRRRVAAYKTRGQRGGGGGSGRGVREEVHRGAKKVVASGCERTNEGMWARGAWSIPALSPPAPPCAT